MIAEPRDIVRSGLADIVGRDARVGEVVEVSRQEEVAARLAEPGWDVLLIAQDWITDMTQMPEGRFAVLASVPDVQIMQAASAQGARGYVTDATAADLIRSLLSPTPGSFLLEPLLAAQVLERVAQTGMAFTADPPLTPREQEVAHLQRQGLTNKEIAKTLSITPATLRTHYSHIKRKRTAAQPHTPPLGDPPIS